MACRRNLEMSGALQSTDVRFYRGTDSFARSDDRLFFGWARVALLGEDSRSSPSFERLGEGVDVFFATRAGAVGTTTPGTLMSPLAQAKTRSNGFG